MSSASDRSAELPAPEQGAPEHVDVDAEVATDAQTQHVYEHRSTTSTCEATATRARLEQLLDEPAAGHEARAQAQFDIDLDDHDKLLIHGANRLGSELLVAMRRRGLDVLEFVDSVRSKWGRSLGGLQIRSLGESVQTHGEGLSAILAWLPPPVGIRRTRLRPHASLLGEFQTLAVSWVPWRCASLALADHHRNWYVEHAPERILNQRDAIVAGFDVLSDDASKSAFVRAIEQRLRGSVAARPDTFDSILDPPLHDRSPSAELGIEPDPHAEHCVYVDLAAGHGHGLQEFVQRSGTRFAGAFVAESNRAREGRLREVVVELQASHAADLEMWTSAAHGDGPESTRRMADALGHWSQRVQQRLRGVRAHLVLDGSTDELELALALRDWMTRVEPRVCASATIGPDAVWRMPGLLQTAMPDALIRMCCDGIDPEIVICRSYPDS